MTTEYQIWIEIEEANDDGDTYHSAQEPMHAGGYETLEQAQAARDGFLEAPARIQALKSTLRDLAHIVAGIENLSSADFFILTRAMRLLARPPEAHRDYHPPLSQGGTAIGHCKKCMAMIRFGQDYCEECKRTNIKIDDDTQQED